MRSRLNFRKILDGNLKLSHYPKAKFVAPIAKALIGAALVALLGVSSCQKSERVLDLSSKTQIAELLLAESKTQNLHSLAFCVVKNDSLLWADALGYADVDKRKSASPETRYLIASVSKALVGVCIFKLVEDGKIDLDEDIGKYLPFKLRNPYHSDSKITVRMLLNHSSSVSDTYGNRFDLYSWNEDSPISLDRFIRDFFEEGEQFYSRDNFYKYTPGSTGNYSNLGYALLGYIVERVSKVSFDQYCKEKIFVPLGMNKSEWHLRNIPLDEIAVPYSPMFNLVKPHLTFPDYPDGGLRTTVLDLSRFLRMLIMKGSFKGVKILNPQTVDLMEKHTITFSVGPEKLDMGLGLYGTDIKTIKLLGHGGNEQGVSTAMHFDPENRVGVIVFTNATAANLNLSIYSLYKYGTKQ